MTGSVLSEGIDKMKICEKFQVNCITGFCKIPALAGAKWKRLIHVRKPCLRTIVALYSVLHTHCIKIKSNIGC